MKYAKNLDNFTLHTIGNDVAGLTHNKFACAGNSTRPPKTRLVSQRTDRVEDTLNDGARGIGSSVAMYSASSSRLHSAVRTARAAHRSLDQSPKKGAFIQKSNLNCSLIIFYSVSHSR